MDTNYQSSHDKNSFGNDVILHEKVISMEFYFSRLKIDR